MNPPGILPDGRLGVAILGSGNIGTDLLHKLLRRQGPLAPVAMVGIDPASEGLARAREQGVGTLDGGLDSLRHSPLWAQVGMVMDATSAYTHLAHAPVLREEGRLTLDLTPAAVGPGAVPVIEDARWLDAPNVNMVTCGGQATLPIVHALRRVTEVAWAEIVAAIASRSAGPGTRANIDEFTVTTARALETLGGAARGKAIIVLNPADPPITMRDTVHALVAPCDPEALRASVRDIVARVQTYVPGYRLMGEPVVEDRRERPLRLPEGEAFAGFRVSVLLEVEGNGDWLPPWAGNLDIMTSAAVRVGELLARHQGRVGGGA